MYSHQTARCPETVALGGSIIGWRVRPWAKESGPGGVTSLYVYESYRTSAASAPAPPLTVTVEAPGWVASRRSGHAPKGRAAFTAATLVGSSSSLNFARSFSPRPTKETKGLPADFHAPAVTGGALETPAPGKLSAHTEHATGAAFAPPFGSNRTSLHPPPDLGTRPIDVASLVYAHHSTPPTSIIGSKIAPAAASELGGSTSLYAAYVLGGEPAARSAK